MLSEPLLTRRREGGRDVPLLLWRAERGLQAISSAPLGGGIGTRHWVLNVTVPMSYDRDDPDRHLADLAASLDLPGPGIGHLTGVDVAEVVPAEESGVRVWATVGLGSPIWAADETEPDRPADPVVRVGTVNIVAVVPARLSAAALVNAVATVTEAKAQALRELGVPATGTATDAVTVLCAPDGPVEAYGGTRSRYGAPLARAVRRAVRVGGAVPVVPWSDRPAQGG